MIRRSLPFFVAGVMLGTAIGTLFLGTPNAHLSSRAWNHPHRSATWKDARFLARVTHNNWTNNDHAHDAQVVAACESGMERVAYNGQYRHSFQMGYDERQTWGYGWTYPKQARGAKAYFVASGKDWSPWSCKPW